MPPQEQKNPITFIFINEKLLISKSERLLSGLNSLPLIPSELAQFEDEKKHLGVESTYGHHSLLDIHHTDFEHADYELVTLRELLTQVPSDDFQFIAQAWQYALFLRTHRYCGRCGHELRQVSWEMAMHCDKCAHRVYPRVSPCIIVAIHNNDKILLAQGVRQQTLKFYSTLAGFVESAESLEQAVHREVFEEVGVKLGKIEYIDSQPWPFPHSLMCGYIAEYASGDIKIEEKEIVDAQWFDIDDLPLIPPKFSIAGRLIEETIRRIKQDKAK